MWFIMEYFWFYAFWLPSTQKLYAGTIQILFKHYAAKSFGHFGQNSEKILESKKIGLGVSNEVICNSIFSEQTLLCWAGGECLPDVTSITKARENNNTMSLLQHIDDNVKIMTCQVVFSFCNVWPAGYGLVRDISGWCVEACGVLQKSLPKFLIWKLVIC